MVEVRIIGRADRGCRWEWACHVHRGLATNDVGETAKTQKPSEGRPGRAKEEEQDMLKQDVRRKTNLWWWR